MNDSLFGLLVLLAVAVTAAHGGQVPPLVEAAEEGDIQSVVQLSSRPDANIDVRDADGNTALHAAAKAGHVEVCELLLHNRAHVNARNKDGYTPVFGPVFYGHVDVVKLLLREGKADPNLANLDRYTPLVAACRNGHSEVVSLLLDNLADASEPTKSKDTALMMASLHGHLDIVKMLVERASVDVDAQNFFGATALMAASAGSAGAHGGRGREGSGGNGGGGGGGGGNGHAHVVSYLTRKGKARVDLMNKEGETAEAAARRTNNADIAKYLGKLRRKAAKRASGQVGGGAESAGASDNPWSRKQNSKQEL